MQNITVGAEVTYDKGRATNLRGVITYISDVNPLTPHLGRWLQIRPAAGGDQHEVPEARIQG